MLYVILGRLILRRAVVVQPRIASSGDSLLLNLLMTCRRGDLCWSVTPVFGLRFRSVVQFADKSIVAAWTARKKMVFVVSTYMQELGVMFFLH